MSSRAVWLVLLVGCGGNYPPVAPEAPEPPREEVEIRIDHVGIGEPCTGPTCAAPRIQLTLRSGIKSATVRVRSVTIRGGEGRSLTLSAHSPTVWGRDGYEPWNETIGPDEVMPIEYSLARVDWDHFANRLDIRATSATVEVDGRERVYGISEHGESSVDDDTAAIGG